MISDTLEKLIAVTDTVSAVSGLGALSVTAFIAQQLTKRFGGKFETVAPLIEGISTTTASISEAAGEAAAAFDDGVLSQDEFEAFSKGAGKLLKYVKSKSGD